MKKAAAKFLLVLTVSLPFLANATVVFDGETMLSGDKGSIQNSGFDLDTQIPYLTSAEAYYNGPDIYIGYLDDGTFRYSEDSLHLSGNNNGLGKAAGIYLFKTDSVVFDTNNDTLTALTTVNAVTNSGTRFVVANGDSFYVSAEFGAGTNSLEVTESTWYDYNPTNGVTSITNFSGSAASVTFNDVGFVGVVTYAEEIPGTRLGYHFKRFETLLAAAPIAVDDTYDLLFGDSSITVAAPGVLGNDPNAVSAVLATNASHGILTFEADGGFSYTATNGFAGTDTFSYVAVNTSGTSTPATVSITVTPLSTPPTANDDTYSLDTFSFSNLVVDAANGVLANDTYPGTNTVFSMLDTDVSNGSLILNTNGSFSYTPNNGFTGDDTFTYVAYTTLSTSTPATVTISVTNIVVNPEVVLYYPFDADFLDATTNGNDGTAMGSASITNDSAFGIGSLDVSQTTDDSVNPLTEIVFGDDDNWSISLWYKDTSGTNAPAGLTGDFGQAANEGIVYNWNSDTNRNYYIRANISGANETWNSTGSVDDGWHHLAFVSDGSGDSILLYEDGVLLPGGVLHASNGISFDSFGKARVGRTEYPFTGLIDEVRIMNYVLSTNEVVQLFTSNTMGGLLPATIANVEPASSDTLKIVVSLDSDPSRYYPVVKTDLAIGGSWSPVAHSDTAGSGYVVSNLSYSTVAAGNNYVIYVNSTNSAEFFRIDAD